MCRYLSNTRISSFYFKSSFIILFTVMESEKCIICHTYKIVQEQYCSSCYNEVHFQEFPESTLMKRYSRQFITHHLLDLWKWSNTYFKTKIEILNDQQSKVLIHILLDTGQSPAVINKYFLGLTDLFPRCTIYAKYADVILQILIKRYSSEHTNYIKWMHSLVRFVFDRWNLITNESTLLCYWKNFGELQCPERVYDLFILWQCIYYPHTTVIREERDSVIIMADCVICYENIFTTQQYVYCQQCKAMYHAQCIGKWLYDKTDQCAVCQTIYELPLLELQESGLLLFF